MGAKGVSAGPGETGLYLPGSARVLEPILLFCSSPLVLMLTGVLVLASLFSIIFFVSGGSHFQDPLFCGESPPRVWGLIPCGGREQRSGIWGEPWNPLRAGSLSRSVCGVLLHLHRRLDHLAGGGWLHFWLHGGLHQRGTTSPHLRLSHTPAVQRAAPCPRVKHGCCSCSQSCSCRRGTTHGAAPAPAGSPGEGVRKSACPNPV